MRIEQHSAPGVEYLSLRPLTETGPPLILVHGAYNDAWIWTRTFMPYFARQRRQVYAIFLKPPARVANWSTLFSYRLSDYTARLRALVTLMDRRPVLVGHSMGGLVVQRFLGQFPDQAAAAVLMASLPPFGMQHTLGAMLRQPRQLLQYLWLTLDPSVARKYPPPAGLLSSQVGAEEKRFFQQHIVRESARALANCLWPRIQVDQVKKTPLLVMGAGLDNLALPEDIRRSVELFGCRGHFEPQMGHFMMLEPGWEELAELILGLK